MNTADDYTDELLKIAEEAYNEGPGTAQEGYVLSMAAERLGIRGNEMEQRILDAWHGLFLRGRLVWGYNLNNPRAPFFHIPR